MGFSKNFETISVLTHATERDVDLLMVEEIVASRAFVEFLAVKSGWVGQIVDWKVLHSYHRTVDRRETEIHVEVLDEVGRVGTMLIENKIAENEQPGQAKSYRSEIDRLRANGDFAVMLLICSKDYQTKNKTFASKFDVLVSFEEIRDHLDSRADLADEEQVRRLRHRANLFGQAISKKARRTWEPIPLKVIGDFNQNYVSTLTKASLEILPGHSMTKPSPPKGSTPMIFNAGGSFPDLPLCVHINRFAHELGSNRVAGSNYVAVTFACWSTGFKRYEGIFEEEVVEIGGIFREKTPNLKRPAPGLVLSVATPIIDNQGSFSEQIHLIQEGILKAVMLRNWILDNRILLETWRERLGSVDGMHSDDLD